MKNLTSIALIFLMVLLAGCAEKESVSALAGDAVAAEKGGEEIILSRAEKGREEHAEKETNAGSGITRGPGGGGYQRDKAEEMIRLMNGERTKAGLSPLSLNEELMTCAEIRAGEQQTAFSHARPDGSPGIGVLDEMGVPWTNCGENLGMNWGYGASEIINLMMDSDGHRTNIMNGGFTRVGVGCYYDGDTYYWAQLFTD